MKFKIIFIIMTFFFPVFSNGISLDKTSSPDILLTQMNKLKTNMSLEGYGVQRLSEIINDALANRDNSSKFSEKVDDFENLIGIIFSLDIEIKKIEKCDLEVFSDQQKIFSLLRNAKFEYGLENYEKSNELIGEINDILFNISFNISEGINRQLDSKLVMLDNPSINKVSDFKLRIKNLINDKDFCKLYVITNEFFLINESLWNLLEINKLILDSHKSGIPDKRLNDLYKEAIFFLEESQFQKVKETYLISKDIFTLAKKLHGEFLVIEDEIIKLSSDSKNELQNKLILAKKDYENSNFEKSSEKIESLKNSINDIKSKELIFGAIKKDSFKFDFILFLKINWFIILTVVILSSMFIKLFYVRLRIRLLHYRLKNLEMRQNNLTELIKTLQDKYYIKKSIPEQIYELNLENYQKKMITISRNIFSLKHDKYYKKG